jgi:hypothetical protein
VNSQQEQRIEFWERLFDSTENAEERKQAWDLAETSDELDVARAGFARTTYPKGQRP